MKLVIDTNEDIPLNVVVYFLDAWIGYGEYNKQKFRYNSISIMLGKIAEYRELDKTNTEVNK